MVDNYILGFYDTKEHAVSAAEKCGFDDVVVEYADGLGCWQVVVY